MGGSSSPVGAVAGLRLAALAAGLKRRNAADLVLIEVVAGSAIAATFTLNRFAAAPVLVARRHLAQRTPQDPSYLLINSGNANAGTGEDGLAVCNDCCALFAAALNTQVQNIIPFSTGVIGEPLPLEPFQKHAARLVETLHKDGWEAAAQGIMTTDTVPKLYSADFELFGCRHTISGIAKGSGMIHPNMATMLAYIATDVSVESSLLQECLQRAVGTSFNRITVDGDTSTNDACVLLATQQGKERVRSSSQPEYAELVRQVEMACANLAQQIVRDAEGASKFVNIEVSQGASEEDCLAVAFTVAHSPLVKTALFASDPNWGRILAAVGRAPIQELDVSQVSLSIGDVLIAEGGAVAASYREEAVTPLMQAEDIQLRITLGAGTAAATVWTSDLSHDYVSINADYRS